MPGGKTSRNKGAKYERDVVAYLESLGVHVVRAKIGNDSGDIIGIPGLVIECKNAKRTELAGWLDQMLEEVMRASAKSGVVFHKRPRRTNVAEHYATTTVEFMLALLMAAGFVEFTE